MLLYSGRMLISTHRHKSAGACRFSSTIFHDTEYIRPTWRNGCDSKIKYLKKHELIFFGNIKLSQFCEDHERLIKIKWTVGCY